MEQGSLFVGRLPRARKSLSGPHHAAARAWCYFWRESRGVAWTCQGQDYRAFKKALELAGGDVEALVRKMRRLLFDPPNAWYAQEASPSLLVARWNNLDVRVCTQLRSAQNIAALRQAAAEL